LIKHGAATAQAVPALFVVDVNWDHLYSIVAFCRGRQACAALPARSNDVSTPRTSLRARLYNDKPLFPASVKRMNPEDDKAQARPEAPLLLHQEAFLKIFYNGQYHYVEYSHSDEGALIIPRFANGDLLLVCLQRAPAFGRSLEFPRGGVERGEDARAGAIRELREETGYRVANESASYLGKVGGDTATLNHYAHVFLIDLAEGAQQDKYDTDEVDSLRRVTMEELKALIRDNSIVDAHTLAAFAMLLART
jgi:8-oxo-dGTP pyrophosphatase MutT (NUDIX family)